MKRNGFTLIELLVVVCIIGILAAIAVPNFLSAQVRSKVSRVKADLRTIATAIEVYSTDHGSYPRQIHTEWYDEDWVAYGGELVRGILWWGLTTPIPYMTTVRFVDPLTHKGMEIEERYYTYNDIEEYKARSTDTFWDCAADYYGPWRLGSVGPDKTYSHGFPYSSQLVYDPSNGTVSLGNIWRTQRLPEGNQPDVGPLLGGH